MPSPAAESSTNQTPKVPGERRIARLSTLVVNQIAAGEVVERPASVVKELVDNAIDANARRIMVELEQGGIELVRVSDDGSGIREDDIALALAPHATSKIRTADDLDSIATMGFRGEALASITSVSRVSIRSRTADSVGESGEGGAGGGVQIDAEGDRLEPAKPAAGPVGTAVTVRNLFFNTPARRKFLRSPNTEQGHGVDVVTNLAMAHPAIGFVLKVEGRVVFDLPPDQSPKERVLELLGSELADQMLEVSVDRFDDARGLAMWGMIGLPTIARANARSQHVFLNGRPIRDKTIQHAVREAYRGLIEPGRYPTAVLMLEMDPRAVDVNVHPAKIEVRFRDQSMIHSTVLRAVREALRAADLTPKVMWNSAAGRPGKSVYRPDSILPGTRGTAVVGGATYRKPDPGAFERFFHRSANTGSQEPLAYQVLKSSLAEGGGARGAGGVGELAGAALIDSERTGSSIAGDGATGRSTDTASGDRASDTAEGVEPSASPTTSLIRPPVPVSSVLQVHNSYMVTQDAEGLLIVDQHALHERVMFEYLLHRITAASSGDANASSGLESQRLLVPAVVDAQPRRIAKLDDLRPLLLRLGIEAEQLSPSSIGVHAFPSFLYERGVEPEEFLADLLDRADSDDFVPASEAALHEVLDMMSCKAAVKAGDHLSERELSDLMKLRDAVERSSNCPHGRPTSIRLTISELEKRFGRS